MTTWRSPSALDELLARVRALIRRSGSEASDRRVRVADLLVDPAARRAWRGARELELTRTEFDLLAHPGAQRRSRLYPHRHLQLGVELRLRSRLEDPGGLRRLPAAEAGGGRRATADPHRSGRRLHAPGAMTLRVRLALALSLLTAIAVTAMALVGYRTHGHRLYQEIDRSLSSSSVRFADPDGRYAAQVCGRLGTNVPDDGRRRPDRRSARHRGPVPRPVGGAIRRVVRGTTAHRLERRAAGRSRGRVVAPHGGRRPDPDGRTVWRRRGPAEPASSTRCSTSWPTCGSASPSSVLR